MFSLVALNFNRDTAVNAYRLDDTTSLKTNGYDWWWHNFVAVSRVDKSLRPFFIEYYIINPGLTPDSVTLGCDGKNRPSYAMMKVGTWGKDAVQLHNFYPPAQFKASHENMEVSIGSNFANDTQLKGSVHVSEADSARPEFFSDAGSISWDLTANKILSFDTGYATRKPFRSTNLLEMSWFVRGMKTEYSGTVTFNNQIYDVFPDRSYGYQDKNWGTEYTNPWIWLSCNKFVSRNTRQQLNLTSLDVGGGRVRIGGISVGTQILLAFYYEGVLHEFSFTNPLLLSSVTPIITQTDTHVTWKIEAKNINSKVELDFSAEKSLGLKINYESPDGNIKHKNLHNFGYAKGTLKFYTKSNFSYILVDTLDGDMGGAEYGEY
ncbi:hypothetical protein HK100_000725 [Physocladia obscura]|uniref:AttH domain-containing protein n=1 Tax=Physocladia obscura TaxID=109957 RepID=A0AAD5SY50_9FUNG|nr:hypothetical protein HK100_000725 [Physocladia obscura]